MPSSRRPPWGRGLQALPLALIAALLAGCSLHPLHPQAPPAGSDWVAAWGSAQLAQAPAVDASSQALRDVTLRQVVRTTVEADSLRVRVSNLFGREPLQLGAASVALLQPGSASGRPALQAGSQRPLSFEGRRELSLAPGAEAWSDPVALAVPRLADVAVQMHVVAAPAWATVHPG